MAKTLSFIIIMGLGIIALSFRSGKESGSGGGCSHCCSGKEDYQKEAWYSELLTRLGQENRADSLDAFFIKTTSSSSSEGSKSIQQTIIQCGKIKESDILSICSEKGDRSLLYVVIRHNFYCHVFTWLPATHKLERVLNKSLIGVTAREKLTIDNYNDSAIVFSARQDEWTKYFYFDKKKNTMTHIKNCHVTNGKETCEFTRYHN